MARPKLTVVPAPPLPDSVASLEAFVQRSMRVATDYQFPSRELDTVMEILRRAGATGQLSIHFTQGGIGRVVFREERKVPVPPVAPAAALETILPPDRENT